MSEKTIDVRCPENPRHLFLKLKRSGEDVPVLEGNLLALACDECKKQQRRSDPTVLRVVHEYNLLGELVTTTVQNANPEEVARLRARGVARPNPSP